MLQRDETRSTLDYGLVNLGASAAACAELLMGGEGAETRPASAAEFAAIVRTLTRSMYRGVELAYSQKRTGWNRALLAEACRQTQSLIEQWQVGAQGG